MNGDAARSENRARISNPEPASPAIKHCPRKNKSFIMEPMKWF